MLCVLLLSVYAEEYVESKVEGLERALTMLGDEVRYFSFFRTHSRLRKLFISYLYPYPRKGKLWKCMKLRDHSCMKRLGRRF